MNSLSKSFRSTLTTLFAITACVFAPAALAADTHLDKDADAALQSLYTTHPAAKILGDKATGILVFPNIVKAGFIVGGQGGDGVLIKNGKHVAYYNNAAASIGLQAGAQSYGFAVFFLDKKTLSNFEKSKGWEIGVGPSFVVVDSGFGKDLNTLTGKDEVYAFIFDQKGLMGGLGLQGSKITKLKR